MSILANICILFAKINIAVTLFLWANWYFIVCFFRELLWCKSQFIKPKSVLQITVAHLPIMLKQAKFQVVLLSSCPFQNQGQSLPSSSLQYLFLWTWLGPSLALLHLILYLFFLPLWVFQISDSSLGSSMFCSTCGVCSPMLSPLSRAASLCLTGFLPSFQFYPSWPMTPNPLSDKKTIKSFFLEPSVFSMLNSDIWLLHATALLPYPQKPHVYVIELSDD